MLRFLSAAVLLVSFVGGSFAADPLKLLFLGDDGHHQPAARFKQLQPALAKRGIELTYSGKTDDLNPDNLKKYAGLIVYANTTKISPEQEAALLDYVESGRGFIPLHCASYCFLNSQKYIDLVGGQFLKHGTGTFRTRIEKPQHPIMQGFDGFESWDETYVHTKHNDRDRTILEFRVDKDGREPWTWVRTQGKGRVFYTAWGHDERTWGNPGFINLVERGIRWAVGEDPAVVPAFTDDSRFPIPQMTPVPKDLKVDFVDVGPKIPNYQAGPQWGKQGELQTKMQQPLPASESMKHFTVPVGFEVKLFIDETKLNGKPIAMTWDERGRLWMCLTLDYPNELQPVGQGRDKIVVCEDTDGDGAADKVTEFADKLSIPTGIAFYRGGVIVHNGVETLYLKDSNGDGKADQRKVLISGWAMGDTHGGVSNFQYGLDGWYYGMQGYNNSEPVLTNGKKTQAFRQGFFRFKVTGENADVAVTELEFLRSTNNNTWGLGLSEEGLVFGSTANHCPSVFMPIPNRYYERVRGMSAEVLGMISSTHLFNEFSDKVRQVDHHGGYTAGCGHALYTARNYPREYWNRTAFVCEPTAKLVGTFILRKDGANYKSSNDFNLIASNDEWSAPIMAEVGPDGNVWVLDWYNFVVQHNPTPIGFKNGKGNAYESDLRDKKHGRVYRVVYKDGQGNAAPKTDDLSPEKLVALLKHDNLLWRKNAQRLLIERGNKDVIPALAALVQDKSVDALGLNVAAIHALQTLCGLNADANVFQDGLKHPSPGVRRNAIQCGAPVAAVVASGAVADNDPQVRLAAFLAIADGEPSAEAAAAVVAALQDSDVLRDKALLDAATIAAAKQGLHFLTQPKLTAESPAAVNAITIVAGNWAAGAPAKEIPSLLNALANQKPEVISAVLAGAAKHWPANKPGELDAAADQKLVQLLEQTPGAAKTYLITLAGRWGSKGLEAHTAKIVTALLEEVTNEQAETKARIAAASRLIDFRKSDAESAGKVLALISPRTAPELAAGLLEAAGKCEAEAIGRDIIGRTPQFTPALRSAALRILLARTDWTPLLLDALDQGVIPLNDLALDQKQALAAHPDKKLAAKAAKLLARGGALPNADRQKVLDDLLPIAELKGDAAAGKEVFKKQCIKCHTHSGEGTKIGPDLTGMAVHPKKELLVHIIDPSRSVEGNFRVYSVLTGDGEVITGLLASESKTTLEFFDSQGKKWVVERDNIDEMKASTKSLMPEGFEKEVNRDQVRDLLEFLTQRGKFLPLPLEKVATVVSTKGMFNSEDADVERLIFADWTPKTFEGVPFQLVDPHGTKTPNAIMLYGTNGGIPPKMPKSVKLPCNAPVKLLHLLSGVSGWGWPATDKGSTTLIVRLHYADGQTEDHPLKNGEAFADYIRRVDVPGSKFAFPLRGQQIRHIAVAPKRAEIIKEVEFVKGQDPTSPVIMAVTAETAGEPEKK